MVSRFFIKTQLDENTAIVTRISEDNVMTACPKCGKRFNVDLNDVVDHIVTMTLDKVLDGDDKEPLIPTLLESTVLCRECTRHQINPDADTGGEAK